MKYPYPQHQLTKIQPTLVSHLSTLQITKNQINWQKLEPKQRNVNKVPAPNKTFKLDLTPDESSSAGLKLLCFFKLGTLFSELIYHVLTCSLIAEAR